jgi:hypothetical protein
MQQEIFNTLSNLEALIRQLIISNSTLAEIIAELESKPNPYSQDGTASCNESSDNQTDD